MDTKEKVTLILGDNNLPEIPLSSDSDDDFPDVPMYVICAKCQRPWCENSLNPLHLPFRFDGKRLGTRERFMSPWFLSSLEEIDIEPGLPGVFQHPLFLRI